MIRRPLRPLARILKARDEGTDPDRIEAEERARRLADRHRAERNKAETRLLLLGVAFVLGFTTVAGRMALLSAAVPAASETGTADAPIRAQRADITDRNGTLLATNIVTAALYAQPRQLIDPERTARALATIFPDLDRETLLKGFTDGRKFLWIRRSVSPEQRQAVHDIGEPGLLFGPRETRLYPNGAVAAHILGGTSFGREGVDAAEIVGVAGVEKSFDERLRDPALTGEPLRLSIDLDLQAALEEVLAKGMADLSAKGAVGILMEARTGRLRAMASLPDFDPNLRPALPVSGDPADSPLFNRAVQGRYELGSVFKPFTVALGLEKGIISPSTMVETKGPMKWGRFTIRDFHDYGPRLTVEDVLVQSSNIGTAHIALAEGAAAQQDFLRRLGLLDGLPVELAETARAKPLLPGKWSDLTTMTVSYGHGLAVSPLHLATAYASLMNGGHRVRPTLVDGSGPVDGERIVSERTSRQLRDMLRQVVVRGTAKLADVPGYDIAGKTGTADKPLPSGGYARDKVFSTFAAVFPAKDPEYVLVIALDEPSNTDHGISIRTAGYTSAPLVAEAVRRIAPLMGMPPAPPPATTTVASSTVGTGPGTRGGLLYTLAGNE